MAWKWIKAFVCLSMCVTSAVGNEEASCKKCADFNNPTWLEYRLGTKLKVQYILLTRNNADCASLFTQDCLNHTQKHTPYFNSSLPTKVIVHGYRALGSKPSWVSGLAKALLQEEDMNVLVVDWVYIASFAYNLVVENYKEVAVQISVLINKLTKYGSTLESFHFIGVSNILIKLLKCLDPAGPMFKSADPFDHLDSSVALFVEAIHTDFDCKSESVLCCASSKFDLSVFIYFPVYGYVICDHMRALHIYMSALNRSCSFIGFPCSSYEEFLAEKCITCEGPFNGTCPQIGLLKNSGITATPLPNQEKVYLLTTATAPYCAHHILVELRLSPLDKNADVQLTLITVGHPETELKLKLNTDEMVYKKVTAHPEQLCKIDSVGLDPLCVKNINIGRGVPWSHVFVQVC
uniref:Phospholipase A1 member A n=1 Tax=Cyprinus carpio TaxID=7962 RepID=A0A8C2CM52_CYPCA